MRLNGGARLEGFSSFAHSRAALEWRECRESWAAWIETKTDQPVEMTLGARLICLPTPGAPSPLLHASEG